MLRLPQKPELILLTSSSLANKGDALMLETVVNHLGRSLRYAIPANCAVASPSQARSFVVHLSTDRPAASLKRAAFNSSIRTLAAAAELMPSKARQAAGIAIDSDVDVAIDVSGYCYGDHWGEALLRKATRQYAEFKRRGVPVILMPKTWGPFNVIPKHHVNALIDNVDLAFARDATSLSFLNECLNSDNQMKILFAPDYTHEVGGRPVDLRHRDATDSTVYIIPSYRVVDSGALSEDRYCRLLASAREIVLSHGGNPSLLIHETLADRVFIRRAASMGFDPSQTVVQSDPEKLKEVIASSAAVITSRLHGLYNSLNSCVPVLVIPWNFKYEEALKQYGCSELLVDMTDPDGSLASKMPLLFSTEERERISATMASGRAGMKKKTEAMWARIERVLSDTLQRQNDESAGHSEAALP